MADRCVSFLLDLKTSIYCTILTTNKVKHAKKTVSFLFIESFFESDEENLRNFSECDQKKYYDVGAVFGC